MMNTVMIIITAYAAMMTGFWFLGMMQAKKQENDHIMERALLRSEYGKDLASLCQAEQDVKELIKEIGGLEMLVKLKDEELNNRDDEHEQTWEDLKPYLMDVKGCIDLNAKLLVILSCKDCTSKTCGVRAEEGKIPEECPLHSAHALHELKIIAKGFSLSYMLERVAAEQAIKEQIKDKEGVA